MITILLVSHSHEVAHGVRRLAAQMAPSALQILAVGGVRTDAGAPYALGTDVEAIVAALQRGWSPHGVLILADLGSSVMGAATAIDLLPASMRQWCLISNAPLVEGAIIAAVEAGLGHDLEVVNRAAEAAAHLIKIDRQEQSNKPDRS